MYNFSGRGEIGSTLEDKKVLVIDYPLWKNICHRSSSASSAAKLKSTLYKFQPTPYRPVVDFERLEKGAGCDLTFLS